MVFLPKGKGAHARTLFVFLIEVLGATLAWQSSAHSLGGQAAPNKPAASVPAPAPPNAPKPSLDVLKSRVITYWNLLARNRKTEAAQYVTPSSRGEFKAWTVPSFTEPRVSTITFSAKSDNVAVTVELKRVFPPPMPPDPINWPVTQNWVFREGSWFVLIDKINPNAIMLPVPGQPVTPPPSPVDVQNREKAIRNAVHFETTEIDFGTVQRGEVIPFSIGYSLTGDKTYSIHFSESPDDFFPLNLKGRELPPGISQTIQAKLLTRSYAGEVKEKIVAMVGYQGAEVPFEIALHGFVYTPVYSTPMTLKLLPGELQADVLVRNASKSQVVIKSDVSSREFKVTPLPQTLPPGGSCTLKITAVRNVTDKNYVDTLSLEFEKPVEGLAGLEIDIIRNYEAPRQKTQEEQLKELLQKSGIAVKK